MSEPGDFPDDIYDPATVMVRIGHLPFEAQQHIEQISRILRGAFGYGGAAMPEQGRIVTIALIGPCADLHCPASTIAGYDFHIAVNLPECADEAHWRFARRLIASEIGGRPVTLVVETRPHAIGIVLYDAASDMPLNARELSLRP